MSKNLAFSNSDGKWIAELLSAGQPIAVEINRVNKGYLIIDAKLDGLRKVNLKTFGPGTDPDIIFEVDVPAGVLVTITSHSEVTDAKTEGT